MTSKTTVFSTYPISKAYAEALRGIVGEDARFITLGQLADKRPWRTIANLRALRSETLAIGLEDSTSTGSLPILKIAAAFTACRRLVVYGPDLAAQGFSRWGQLVDAVRLALVCARGLGALALAQMQLRQLAGRERIQGRLPPGASTAAYINTNLWFGVKAGGSVGHISGVANGFLARGLAVDYFTVGGRLLLREAARHVELSPPRAWALPYALNYYLFDRSFQRQVQGRLDPDKTLFLYQRLSIGNFSGARLSRATGLPLVVEYNGSEVWVADKWGTGLRFRGAALAAEAQTLRNAHVVVTISDVLRDELIARGVEPARIVAYPNCIDPLIFDPARFGPGQVEALRRAQDIPAGACLATFVGTFGVWHGAEVLAAAIARLCIERPQAVDEARLYFMFVGDGLRMPEVRRILDHPACRPRVRLLGLVPQDEAPAYLAASDIFVAPHVTNADGTRFFGSPTKLFEYMAMQKPILASDLDQIGEVLRRSLRWPELDETAEPDPLAVLLPPGDIEALAEGLLHLAARPELRERLGAAARREALEKYTWERHVGAILERVAALCGESCVVPTRSGGGGLTVDSDRRSQPRAPGSGPRTMSRLETLALAFFAFAVVGFNGRPERLSDGFAMIAVLVFFWINGMMHRRLRFTVPPSAALLVAAWFVWVVAAWMAVLANPGGGAEMLANGFFSYLLPFLLMLTLIGYRLTPEQTEVVLLGLCLGVVVRFTYGMIVFHQTWGVPSIATLATAHFNFLRILPFQEATFGNTSNTASLISPLLVLMAIALLILRLSLVTTALVIASLAVLLITGLITGSRAFVFVSAVPIGLACIKLNVRWGAPLALGMLAVYAFLNSSLGAENLSRFGNVATSRFTQDQSLIERSLSIRIGLDTIAGHLLGVGPGMSHLYNAYSVSHQFAVNQGVDTGLIGMAATVVLAVVVVVKGLKVKLVVGSAEFAFKFAGLAWFLYAMTTNLPTGFGPEVPWIGLLALFVSMAEMTRDQSSVPAAAPVTPRPQARPDLVPAQR